MKLSLWILSIIYAVPILQAGLFLIPPVNSKYLRRFNSISGRLEWFAHPWRDTLGVFYLLYVISKNPAAYYYLIFIVLSAIAFWRFRHNRRNLAEFGRNNPFIHPKIFFEYYYSGLGFIPIKLTPRVQDADAIVRAPVPPSTRLFPIIAGVLNTCMMTRIILAAHKWRGPEYARKVADGIAIIWSARIVYLGRFSIKTAGLDKLKNLEGKFIFVFNHKSFLDFAVGPLAISPVRHSFRFLAARDHFLDNLFLYNIMGRAMEVAGTIFVDRKKKKESPRFASLEAAEKLANFETDIIMFPQGTRAYGDTAGYYTSGSKERLLKKDGHLKKGAAHIAVDTAIFLKKRECSQINIVPIGITGTGAAAPKGAIRVKTGLEITVKISEPIIIRQADVAKLETGTPEYAAFVEKIHATIDERLKEILEIHAGLEKRFFKDIRGLLPATDYEHTSVTMKAWRGKDYLIYTILDCIYAVGSKEQSRFLRELCYLMISDAPAATLVHFKGRVIEMIK
ncbi:MAG: hypothetical protein A3I09_00965 [Deltaproteobacteria bacterium RIFCSPLOWO2_02_FULL_47_10]|nr:MAG: hypothetical protein A3I09_00965 [Deltaproteobacteria bacterium RIFCSPLOWO2_02_FULL_47_10]